MCGSTRPSRTRSSRRRETTNVIMNADGLLAEVPKDGHDTIPHFIKASIETPEDWKRVKEERFRRDDPARKVDVEALKERHPADRDYPLGVDCGSMIGKIRDMLTFEGLAYACYDYPEMVEDMVETACVTGRGLPRPGAAARRFRLRQRVGRHLLQERADRLGPTSSRTWSCRATSGSSQRLQAAGIDLWYTDCDGDVRPILPYMMEGGINCLFPFEVNGCAHPGELLERVRHRPAHHGRRRQDRSSASGREAIKAYLDTLVPLVERGGYIPFCDHRCPPNVNPDDYLYYLDLKEAMFGMK